MRLSSRLTVDGDRPSRRAILAHAQPAAAQRRDPLPLQLRQIPAGPIGLAHPQRREAAPLGPPPIAGLAPDPHLSAGFDRANTVEDQSPVLVFDRQLPLASPSPELHTPRLAGVLRQGLEPARRQGVKSGPSLTQSNPTQQLAVSSSPLEPPAVRLARGVPGRVDELRRHSALVITHGAWSLGRRMRPQIGRPVRHRTDRPAITFLSVRGRGHRTTPL